ncbi:ABC transporter ATP-binding protein [Mycolicibacterium sp. S2-37]|uniref:ABC transporter ATP-binding protein n=1 Tax=Mycolicibacterium sp. S2-37 TaxID=2810297 RepID=UPI001A93C152|nr:ABC transporter ATP-binding protein [Mycolicibacterium sp. S2-37]MBO0680843.1 ABC transporter ATP-binding protein [Mycolicibacterium sp. S2-37]
MPNTELEVSRLVVRVGNRLLIDDLSIDVGAGRFVGLLGPNGSGKSTLLKAIYRVLRPQQGVVRIGGVPTHTLSARDFARTLAVVAQEAPIEVEVSVIDMVLLGRIPHQGPLSGTSSADRAAAERALATVDAVDLGDRSWPTLSGGEKQRVLLARALAQDGRILVLDEPTNHLDVRHQFGLLNLLRRLGVTTLAALHDFNLAAEFCDEVVVVQDGSVVAAGPPAEVLVDEVVHPVFGVHVDQVRHPRTGALRLLLSSPDPAGAARAPVGAPSATTQEYAP